MILDRLQRLAAPAVVNAKSVGVIVRSGAMDFKRPDHLVAAAKDMRTIGPLASPVKGSARRFPDTIAIIDDDTQITYRELERTVDRLAAALHKRGIGPDSVVGMLCRDRLGLVQAKAATGQVGARVVFLNTSMSAKQTAEVCVREGISAIMHDSEFAEAALAAQPRVRVVVHGPAAGAETIGELIAEGANLPAAPRPSQPGSMVILTGGTTGLPKGASRSVSNPLAAAGMIERIPVPLNGVTVYAAPMFHGTGLSQFLYSMTLGSTNVLRAKFDPEATLAAVEKYRATTLVLVPTMLHRILSVPDNEKYDTSSLQVIFSAGSGIPISVGNKAIERFGPTLYNFYGSSEVSVVTVAKPEDWIAAPGCAGYPPSVVTVRLIDADSNVVEGPNKRGTIYAGSALMFDGYSGGGTKKMIDGLMSTGDVGHWDADGRLHVDGRDDDMIASGGENVFPGEVEDLLYAHPKIREAAVFGVPDDEFGQRLAAVLVLEDGAEFPADEVRAHVKENLARYKQPRDVHYLDELPRTASGKLLRRNLIADFGGQ
ncbi:AMP-binding protein [Jongsikchunia kroppenstedtii]|uniref:AMP-binding protein n=1 Tax=Jongsikchunia kroppenstedtii TaxID=1121721 RepID=UPI000382BC36|nr:AMP-binding protein [Jongsikchunia kroppenstedtii]